jgi:hypothetical protein
VVNHEGSAGVAVALCLIAETLVTYAGKQRGLKAAEAWQLAAHVFHPDAGDTG